MKSLFRISGFMSFILIAFMNAFVDLGHKIVIQNTVFKTFDGQEQIILTAIVNGLILLPFIFLFTPSGWIADRFSKPKVMRISAAVAVVLTALITLCYYQGWFWPAFAMTFLLAVQSAFYSPAKYGYIKELTGNAQLAAANGVVQMVTTSAILGGILFFSILFEMQLGDAIYSQPEAIMPAIAPIGFLLILISIAEFAMTYYLPAHEPVANHQPLKLSRYLSGKYLSSNLKDIFSHRTIWLSIFGLAVFWSIGQVMVAAFPAHAKEVLGETNTIVIQGILAASGLGIVLGSLLGAKACHRHIELGLIPLGAAGIVLGLLLLPILQTPLGMAAGFLLLGASGGIFVVPLNALIQYHAKDEVRGTVLAGSNWIQNVAMLMFLVLTSLFALLGLDSIGLFAVMAVVAIVGAIYTIRLLPQSLARFMSLLVMARRYRISVSGFENLPEEGGVLLLGNHISWLDWAMIQIASPRPVRFVMERSIYERWYLKWALDMFGVIPISAGQSRQSLETVNARLKAGEVVCLFPEGTISRNGQLSRFRSGFERAVEGVDGVIVPFYLRGLWGSWFSYASSKLKDSRGYRLSRRNIIVAFGPAIAIDSNANTVKQKVSELSVSAWKEHVDELPDLSSAWIDMAKRLGTKGSLFDTTGKTLNNHEALTGAIVLGQQIAKRSAEKNIGLLLPTSAAGVLANMAVLLQGKTIVNLNYTASMEAMLGAVEKAEIKSIYTSRRFVKKLQDRGIQLDQLFSQLEVYYLEDVAEDISKWNKLLVLLSIKLLPTTLLKWIYRQHVDNHDTAAILFSSGSEGSPKGVPLSHRNIMGNVQQIADVLDTREEDVVMGTLPLFHAFGMTVTSFLPLIEGMPLVCHPDPTDALNIGKAIAKHRATVLCGTSTFLRLYARNRKVHPLMFESLRVVVAGAEKLNDDVREAFKLKFNKDIYEGYGATETTPVASVNIPDYLDTRRWNVQHGHKVGSVGMPLPGTSFRIVDPQTLEELAQGEDGLILIGGAQVMDGYLKDAEKSAQALVQLDGVNWYKTGDKGHLDEDGFLTIVDRYSRFAKIGGEMVSLGAVEAMLRKAINDSEIELAAVNLPDSKKGEKIILLLNGDKSIDDIKRQVQEASDNPLMNPTEYYIVDDIPKLGSGKADFSGAKKLAKQLSEGVKA